MDAGTSNLCCRKYQIQRHEAIETESTVISLQPNDSEVWDLLIQSQAVNQQSIGYQHDDEDMF